jgi:hypothetical protein
MSRNLLNACNLTCICIKYTSLYSTTPAHMKYIRNSCCSSNNWATLGNGWPACIMFWTVFYRKVTSWEFVLKKTPKLLMCEHRHLLVIEYAHIRRPHLLRVVMWVKWKAIKLGKWPEIWEQDSILSDAVQQTTVSLNTIIYYGFYAFLINCIYARTHLSVKSSLCKNRRPWPVSTRFGLLTDDHSSVYAMLKSVKCIEWLLYIRTVLSRWLF